VFEAFVSRGRRHRYGLDQKMDNGSAVEPKKKKKRKKKGKKDGKVSKCKQTDYTLITARSYDGGIIVWKDGVTKRRGRNGEFQSRMQNEGTRKKKGIIKGEQRLRGFVGGRCCIIGRR
jgi:hypothetical protein